MTFLSDTEESRRLFWLKAIICTGFFCGIAQSFPLWLSDRVLPRVPLFELLSGTASPYPAYLPEALLLILALGAFLPSFVLIPLFALIAFAVCEDQLRLQPWVEQYTLMLFAVVATSQKNPKKALTLCRLIICCIYFWSGLQKINVCYFLGIAPWFIEPFSHGPVLTKQLLVLTALLSPFLECVTGILLLFPSLRRIGVVLAVLMHLFILIALGPFGRSWNYTVLPWNLIMILLDLRLFISNDKEDAKQIVVPRSPLHFITLFLFGIAPLGSFFGVWDYYLSSALYSGNPPYAHMDMNQAESLQLPKKAKEVLDIKDGVATLSFISWSERELGVPVIPQIRVFRPIAKALCQRAAEKSEMELVIFDRPPLFSTNRAITKVSCSELLSSE